MLISSKMTSFYKRVFPLLWFGFLAVFVLMAVPASFTVSKAPNQRLIILPFLVVPAIMAGFGYFFFRSLIFDLADEVNDEGAYLNIRKGDVAERIALTDIINVNSTVMVNPPRITLTLRRPCALGDKVSFMPPARFAFFPGFSIHPIAEDLIRRIDAKKNR
jgi:hypothetical protein